MLRGFYRVACVLLWLFIAVTIGRAAPSRQYSSVGRVVKRANGEYAVYDGIKCDFFPHKDSRKQLAEHLGKFIKVEFSAAEDQRSDMRDYRSRKIDKISTLADGPQHLPVRIDVSSSKQRYQFIDPVRLTVRIVNQTQGQVNIRMKSAVAACGQDYRTPLYLEPYFKNHFGPYPHGVAPTLTLAQEQSISFSITSDKMLDPSTYQIVFCVPGEQGLRYYQSEILEITILPPANDQEYLQALRTWFNRASPGQRIEIAEKLIEKGDHGAKQSIIQSLESGIWPYDGAPTAFRLAWKYGGEKGGWAMMRSIDKQSKQDNVLRMIEQVFHSPKRILFLKVLLDNRKSLKRDTAGSVAEPRVCDITASWLCGYTNYKMTFPRNGSVQERDTAIAKVAERLKEDPTYFSVLSKPTE